MNQNADNLQRRSAMRFTWALLAGLGMFGYAGVTASDARANKMAEEDNSRFNKTEKKLAGGTHWRIESDRGPIHVWIPGNYDRETAGTVVYVHGYYVTADKAWKQHKLPEQFSKSRQNAMFIVPEAPSGNGQAVVWDSLADLKKAVARGNIRMPDGPAVIIGHSGAFRTLSQWVDNKLLAQVILLDALYGKVEAFDAFIDSGNRAEHHKLVIVASDTAAKSKAFTNRFPYAVVKDKIPATYGDFTKREKRAKLLYLRSQYGHAQIVENQEVIPLVLRLTPLARL